MSDVAEAEVNDPVMDEWTEFNLAMMDNILAMKQEWPHRRRPAFLPATTGIPVPPLANRARVQGEACLDHPSEQDYLQAGYEEMRCVLNIAEVYGFKGGTVLDWGVGCGRMASFLPRELRLQFTGVDVDPINIDWCEKNIPFGDYWVLDHQRAVIPVKSRSFDLIYSYSVLTHLAEQDQDRWLEELARVSRGVIVVSVHSLHAAARIASWASLPRSVGGWLRRGFRDAGVPNGDIADVVDAEYYRDVAHTPVYIREHWSRYVDVLDVIPGGIGKDHDAVVCVPKGTAGA